MGRVNLDQLEMIKGQGSSTDDEEEKEIMDIMVADGKVTAEEDEDEGMEMMENMMEEQREVDDEEMENNIKEEEEDEEEEEEIKEVEDEKPTVQGNTDVTARAFILTLLSNGPMIHTVHIQRNILELCKQIVTHYF